MSHLPHYSILWDVWVFWTVSSTDNVSYCSVRRQPQTPVFYQEAVRKGYPSKSHPKLKSREISFLSGWFLCCLIVWKLCILSGIDTTPSVTTVSYDRITLKHERWSLYLFNGINLLCVLCIDGHVWEMLWTLIENPEFYRADDMRHIWCNCHVIIKDTTCDRWIYIHVCTYP